MKISPLDMSVRSGLKGDEVKRLFSLSVGGERTLKSVKLFDR
jgi:hypothetical protein